MKINSKTAILASVFLLIGFLAGFLMFRFDVNCDTDAFNYINKELICKDTLIVGKHSYTKLKHDLEGFIQRQKNEKKVIEVSIYFRDLQNGPTLGINEHELFSPASLLKLPLLLTYENLQNEKYPGLLEREIIAKDTGDTLKQYVLPKEFIEYGKTYSINDLIVYMIKYSDNKSYYVLLNYLREISPNEDLLKNTYVDLGIIDPKDFLDNTISVKSYGSIFVQLFHSSYFNQKKISDQVLSLLTEVDWNNGINAGVPRDIKVAHKFGERSNLDMDLKQLHDCGVVYYPNNPYLICVMTRGYDLDTLADIIGGISLMFYEEFDSRKL